VKYEASYRGTEKAKAGGELDFFNKTEESACGGKIIISSPRLVNGLSHTIEAASLTSSIGHAG
jgi:hypothetical protein